MPEVYKELFDIQHHLAVLTDMQVTSSSRFRDGKPGYPVPQRQAHGRCHGEDRHGHAARGAD